VPNDALEEAYPLLTQGIVQRPTDDLWSLAMDETIAQKAVPLKRRQFVAAKGLRQLEHIKGLDHCG